MLLNIPQFPDLSWAESHLDLSLTDLIGPLYRVGHGGDIAICDGNFDAVGLGRELRVPVVFVPKTTIMELLPAILAFCPIDHVGRVPVRVIVPETLDEPMPGVCSQIKEIVIAAAKAQGWHRLAKQDLREVTGYLKASLFREAVSRARLIIQCDEDDTLYACALVRMGVVSRELVRP